jgi:AraC-like DNA-binding protein
MAVVREVLGRVRLRLEVEPLGNCTYRAIVEHHSWAAASLYFCETTPLRTSRTPELIRDGADDFRLVRAEGARYQYSSRGISHEIDNPDAIFLTSTAPSVASYLGPCRITALHIPRKSISYALGNVEDMPVRRIDAASLPMRLLMGYIDILRREGPASDAGLAHQTAQHLVELAALALDPSKERQMQSAGAVRKARLASVQADILANLAQVSLSAKTIARRHGVSSRYIHRLFEETGQTFGSFVLEVRLERALQLLSGPAHAHMRISDIASNTGFGDISTFNRAFKRRFGDTPRVIRHKAGE